MDLDTVIKVLLLIFIAAIYVDLPSEIKYLRAERRRKREEERRLKEEVDDMHRYYYEHLREQYDRQNRSL